jgi:predicted amidohydrolase YtcJ
MRKFVLLATAVCAAMISPSQSAPNSLQKADTVYVHGNLYTGVPGKPSLHDVQRAQALAVKGDIILAVGTDAEVMTLKGSNTVVVDLQGNFLMPGFNDAHMHLADAGFKKLYVDLTGTRSLEQFRDRIRSSLATAKPGEWIVGSGWDETLWPVKKVPTSVELDEITRDHPVYLDRIDGHVAVANTLALKIARITAASKDPEGGEIGRDPAGQPNGILRETARDAVSATIPGPSREKRRQAIQTALQDIAASGVTSVQDNSDSENGDAFWDDFQIFEQLEREGRLTVRISEWMPFADSIESLKQRRAAHSALDSMLRTGMLKAFMDGSLGSHTAAMAAPFADDPENSGLARYEQEKLNEMAKERLAAGFQLGFHAIGDRAVQIALNAFAEAEKQAREKGIKALDGSKNYRLRVEHAQVTNPQLVARFRELNVVASMQPSHLLTDMHWAEARLGKQRAEHSYAWAEFLNKGVVLAFGTDYPVEPVSPFRGLYSAVTRRSEDGSLEYYPAQKLTIDQAIAAYTTGSAYAEFAEKYKGTLAPGMLADFVVLDRDLTAIAPAQILGTRVLRTVVGGKTVFPVN